jgi:hypothetical protein
MDIKFLSTARRLFNVDYVPREINRANQRKWIRSVRALGDKSLLAKQVNRTEEKANA